MGAAPGVGQVFEPGAGEDVAHGVALGGVVNITADGAAVFLHSISLSLEMPGLISILFYIQKMFQFEDNQENSSVFYTGLHLRGSYAPLTLTLSPRKRVERG